MAQTSTIFPQQAVATGVCHSLHRAYRDQRLYPPGHPTPQESLEGLAAAVGRYFEQWGTLALEVREDALALEGEPVYQRDASRDNLAFLLFRDGLRTLSLHPGCEFQELESFVDCLAHADDLASMEHDLVTALWERDLGHIDYQVVDPFMGGGTAREGMMDTLRETVVRRLEMVSAQSFSAGEVSGARMRNIQARSYPDEVLRVTAEELERGEREISGLSPVVQDYAEVILEVASKVPITSSGDVIIQSMAVVVAAFLDEENLAGAKFVLTQLGKLEAERWCPAGSVGFVAGGAITTGHVRGLLESARAASSERFKETQAFLLLVRKWITPSFLEILTETEDRTVRKTVLEILGDEGAVTWRDLEPLLRDPRWYVVRNAVQLAAGLGHEELADEAGRLLGHQDVRVRREVVRALGGLRSQATVRGLTQALSDSDPSVRTLAASALGRKGGPEQKTVLLARIADRNFSSLSPEEMEAFLGAYAELAQTKAVALLDRMWRKSLFSSRPQALRAAALLALGRVRSPEAQAALHAAAKSRDPYIQRAAAEAAKKRAETPYDEP